MSGYNPFRFFNICTEHDEFLEVVQEAWNMPVYGVPMYKVCKKLKALKAKLKVQNKTICSNVEASWKEAEYRLEK